MKLLVINIIIALVMGAVVTVFVQRASWIFDPTRKDTDEL